MLTAEWLSTDFADEAQTAPAGARGRDGIGFRLGQAELAGAIHEIQGEHNRRGDGKESRKQNQQREHLSHVIQLQGNQRNYCNPERDAHFPIPINLPRGHQFLGPFPFPFLNSNP